MTFYRYTHLKTRYFIRTVWPSPPQRKLFFYDNFTIINLFPQEASKKFYENLIVIGLFFTKKCPIKFSTWRFDCYNLNQQISVIEKILWLFDRKKSFSIKKYPRNFLLWRFDCYNLYPQLSVLENCSSMTIWPL